MKKNPAKNFKKVSGKVPITAQMACESVLRYSIWLKNGCNMFDSKSPVSNPMSFWTEQDVLEYIRRNDIEIASVYGFIAADYNGQTAFDDCGCKLCTTGCDRTGCIFCGFGAHLEKGEGRFERLKRTHPKQYDYCMNGGSYDSDGIWKPDKNGLGMKHVIDTLNSLYGEEFIKY
jgi:3'-phosphoadenosine 5'-phosphosulfate sulfotransferase (PAPS reductase)/FAD synthetase